MRVAPDTAVALATMHAEHSQLAVGHPDAWRIPLGLWHAYLRRSGESAQGPFQVLHAGETAATLTHAIASHQRE